MKEKQITISCQVFESMEQLDARDRALCEAAMEARKSSYAPYSGFNVGAAVLLEGGITVKGSNQENAAFPSSLCAERTAMYSASANYPGKAMLGIAIVGGKAMSITDKPVTPCGACRQVMAEYEKRSGVHMSILLIGRDEVWKFSRVEDLLPFIFDSI